MKRIRRQLKRKDVLDFPYKRWNAFIDLLALENSEILSDIQRTAQSVFCYDSEVQNGGHFQFFENVGITSAQATVPALFTMGALCQARILETAVNRWSNQRRQSPLSVEEFVELAVQGEFANIDAEYYRCVPAITELLEQYLDKNEAEFIEYEGG